MWADETAALPVKKSRLKLSDVETAAANALGSGVVVRQALSRHLPPHLDDISSRSTMNTAAEAARRLPRFDK